MTSRRWTLWALAIVVLATLGMATARVADAAADSALSDEGIRRAITQLGDADAIVRLRAAKALGEMGPAARAAIPALTKLLEDPDEDIRTVTARALHKIGAGDDDSVQKLIEMLSDDDAMVRLKAAKSLGEKGSSAAAAVPALQKLADDPDEDVRGVAATALRKIWEPAVAPPPSEATKPDVADLVVTDQRSLYCEPYLDPVGIRSTPAQRFFLVRLRNDSVRPVRVEEIVLTWLDEGRDVGSEFIEVKTDTVPPGGQIWVSFLLRSDDRYYTWKLRVGSIAELELDDEQVEELRRQDRQHDAMKLVRIKPITSMGVVMGHEFTVVNPSDANARGVRIAFYGFDRAGKLVEIQILHAERLPPGELRLVWCMSRPEDYQKATSFFTLEELFSAERIVNVTRYTGEVLAVGAAANRSR